MHEVQKPSYMYFYSMLQSGQSVHYKLFFAWSIFLPQLICSLGFCFIFFHLFHLKTGFVTNKGLQMFSILLFLFFFFFCWCSLHPHLQFHLRLLLQVYLPPLLFFFSILFFFGLLCLHVPHAWIFLLIIFALYLHVKIWSFSRIDFLNHKLNKWKLHQIKQHK